MSDHFPWCRTPCPAGRHDMIYPPKMFDQHRGPVTEVQSRGSLAKVWIEADDGEVEPVVALAVGTKVSTGHCRLDPDAAIRYALALIDEAQKIGGKYPAQQPVTIPHR